MAKYVIIYGAVLSVLGIVAYLFTGMAHWTALIPLLFGLPILLLGVWGNAKEDMAVPATIFAVVLAFVGFVGSVGAIPDFIGIVGGGEPVPEDEIAAEEQRRAAVVTRTAMAVITLVFMIQAIRQIVKAQNE